MTTSKRITRKAIKKIVISGLILSAFALVGNFAVVFTEDATRDKIAYNKRQALLSSLYQLIDKKDFDNDILADQTKISDPLLSQKQSVTLYRAYYKGEPVAAIIQSIAPDGYSGRIFLLVGIKTDGSLLGVRVTEHKETPGLGDGIDVNKSDWILGFDKKSLNNPEEDYWNVKKDGGVFDQFSGATISPRAIVKAVHKTLKYYQQQNKSIFNKDNKDE